MIVFNDMLRRVIRFSVKSPVGIWMLHVNVVMRERLEGREVTRLGTVPVRLKLTQPVVCESSLLIHTNVILLNIWCNYCQLEIEEI